MHLVGIMELRPVAVDQVQGTGQPKAAEALAHRILTIDVLPRSAAGTLTGKGKLFACLLQDFGRVRGGIPNHLERCANMFWKQPLNG